MHLVYLQLRSFCLWFVFFSLRVARGKDKWETDIYTPPVLGGAGFFDNSAPAVYKKYCALRTLNFYTPLALNCLKGHHLPAPEVYKNQSPKKPNPISGQGEPYPKRIFKGYFQEITLKEV